MGTPDRSLYPVCQHCVQTVHVCSSAVRCGMSSCSCLQCIYRKVLIFVVLNMQQDVVHLTFNQFIEMHYILLPLFFFNRGFVKLQTCTQTCIRTCIQTCVAGCSASHIQLIDWLFEMHYILLPLFFKNTELWNYKRACKRLPKRSYQCFICGRLLMTACICIFQMIDLIDHNLLHKWQIQIHCVFLGCFFGLQWSVKKLLQFKVTHDCMNCFNLNMQPRCGFLQCNFYFFSLPSSQKK